jgi:hypothetical protein
VRKMREYINRSFHRLIAAHRLPTSGLMCIVGRRREERRAARRHPEVESEAKRHDRENQGCRGLLERRKHANIRRAGSRT